MNRRLRRALEDAVAASHNYARVQEGYRGLTVKGKQWRAIIRDCYIVINGKQPDSGRALSNWIIHLLDSDRNDT